MTLYIHNTYAPTLYTSYIHPKPIPTCTLTRILSRVQAVFYRQTINWMIYGHCPDTYATTNNTTTISSSDSPHHQSTTNLFFIQPIHPTSNLDRGNTLASTSFTLLLDRIPTSHVSPKLASRILFAGKTGYLLQHDNTTHTTTNTNNINSSNSNSSVYAYDKELFRYFTSSEHHHQQQEHLIKEEEKEEEAQGELETPYTASNNNENKENINLTHKQPFTNPTTTSTAVTDKINELNQLQFGLVPPYFSLDIINKYAIQMQTLLSITPEKSVMPEKSGTAEKSVMPEKKVTPEKSVLLFETLVDDIYMYISNVLWRVLVDKYSVYEHFHMIRNIYLLGQ